MTDLLRRLDESRDFPANTCPASRHAQMIAEALMRGEDYPMLSEEPEHCGESIGATVAALYEARTRLKDVQAENERLREKLHLMKATIEARSELFISDQECMYNMLDRIRLALNPDKDRE